MVAKEASEGLSTAAVGNPPPGDRDRQQEALSAEVAALSSLNLDGLRSRWLKETRRPAPAHVPKFLLLRMVAYRVQANVLGDLDPETKRALDRFARETKRAASGADRKTPRRPPRVLKPGTILVREWNGGLHRVTVLNDGFAWNGETYRSLSTVAKAITGTSWSGPRFFGLLDAKKAGQPVDEPSSR